MSKLFKQLQTGFLHLRNYGLKSFFKLILIKIGIKENSLQSNNSQSIIFAELCRNIQNSLNTVAKSKNPYTVIIPIHNGVDHLRKLKKSLADSHLNILLVDDCSTEPEAIQLIDEWAKSPRVRLIRNLRNLGFTQSVNLATQKIDHDFILLNSDTEVHGNWSERLIDRLYANEYIAAVTPFSNAATIFSWPEINDQPMYFTLPQIDKAMSEFNLNMNFPSPTINGFCVAIKRVAWEKVGNFNEKIFEVGYGEENDWSIRARHLGYTVELAPNVFIRHAHGGSFDPAVKQTRLDKSWKDLQKLHPSYRSEVLRHLNNDPWKHLRISIEIFTAFKYANAVNIYITHGIGGGAEVWLDQDISHKLKKNIACLILLPGSKGFATAVLKYGVGLSWREVRIDQIPLAQLEFLLNFGRVTETIVNNLVGWNKPFELIQKLSNFSALTFVGHDYFAICPSYNLLNASEEFCGIPEEIAICNECVLNNNLISRSEAFQDLYQWRKEFQFFFSLPSTRMIFFSGDSKSWFSKVYKIHEEQCEMATPDYVSKESNLIPKRKDADIINIAFVGHINLSKGARVVSEIIKISKQKKLPYQFHLIGEIRDINLRNKNITIHGRYERRNLAQILQDMNIDIVIIPSIWPETYNIVTDEVVQAGIRTIVSPLGAMAERYNDNERVWLSPGIHAENYLQIITEITKAK